MTNKNSILVIAVIACVALACESTNETHRLKQLPYQEFRAWWLDGTLAQRVQDAEFAQSNDIFGKEYALVWLKNERPGYVMYLPSHFITSDLQKLPKTKFFRLSCGNCALFAPILKCAFEAALIGALLFSFRSEFSVKLSSKF